MQTEGYTVFSGPLKHSNKKNEDYKVQNEDFTKKSEYTNKNSLDGKHVAKLMNAEEDRLRIF